jgi:hypothetical protein
MTYVRGRANERNSEPSWREGGREGGKGERDEGTERGTEGRRDGGTVRRRDGGTEGRRKGVLWKDILALGCSKNRE